MNGGTVFVIGIVGIVGAGAYKMSNHDPMLVDLPVAEVKARLASAVTTWPADKNNPGNGVGSIMPAGPFSAGVNVQLKYSSHSGTRDCKILLTAVDEGTTRMASECTNVTFLTDGSDSALQRAGDESDEVFIDEHARSVMAGDTFDLEGAEQRSTDIFMRDQHTITAEGLEGA